MEEAHAALRGDEAGIAQVPHLERECTWGMRDKSRFFLRGRRRGGRGKGLRGYFYTGQKCCQDREYKRG
jgi:hypothetical protein